MTGTVSLLVGNKVLSVLCVSVCVYVHKGLVTNLFLSYQGRQNQVSETCLLTVMGIEVLIHHKEVSFDQLWSALLFQESHLRANNAVGKLRISLYSALHPKT